MLPLLLVVCALLLAVDYAVGRYRYRKRKLHEKFRIEVFRNLEILSWFGGKRKDWETLQELRERLEGLPEFPRLCFLDDYEHVIYGGAEVSQDMLEGAVQAREMLLGLLKKEKKRAYLYCRMALFFGKNK